MDRDLLASDYSFNTSRTQSLSEGVAFLKKKFAFDSSWCLVFFAVDSLFLLHKRSTCIPGTRLLMLLIRTLLGT